MKKSLFVSLAVILPLLLASGAAFGATYEKKEGMGATTGMQQQQQFQQQNLRSIDQLSNLQVQSLQGENLGQVQDVIVDLNQGQIGYVVIGSTEVAQMEEKFIVPFNALQTSIQQDVLTLKVDRAKLMSAPEGDIQQALTRQEGQEIHQFYGVAPYWEESELEEIQQEPSLQEQEQQQVK